MKNFIYKTNQYLLERYPTIWNTKIVWVLAASFIIHIIFYLLGILSVQNPETLHEYRTIDNYFDNGTVFLNIIITVLILVIWIINLFKNNAFKNFYPNTKGKLFKQFICYLLIIFCSSTFYYSYIEGVKTTIDSKYPDKEYFKDISDVNKGAIFFSQNIHQYTLDKKYYPKIFTKLYCEQNKNEIDTSKTHFNFLDRKYQFFTLRTEKAYKSNYYKNPYFKESVKSEFLNDSTKLFYFKDKISNVSEHIKSAKPAYYNYSSLFYEASRLRREYEENGHIFSLKKEGIDFFNELYIRVKNHNQLLQLNNSNEIKKLLSKTLGICNKLKIKHNLNSQSWYQLINTPNFEVKQFIKKDEDDKYSYNNYHDNLESISYTYDDYDNYDEQIDTFEEFVKSNTTELFIETDNLKRSFENIEEIKTKNIYKESIHFFIWISFGIACLIFCFRVTNLKTLLLSIITVGVLSVLVALLSAMVSFITYRGDIAYFSMYLTLLISTLILATPLFFYKKTKKIISGICLNISITGLVLYLLLIIGIISFHQQDYCRHTYVDYNLRKENCKILIEIIEPDIWSSILFIIGMIFMYFYGAIIKRWKALPEG